MTTATTTTNVGHTSSATFQAWYNEIITQLTAVGLTQTADTGQISSTASIPTTNTSAGYTIWTFNDTLQDTAPIYIKLEFGTGSSTTFPQMWMTVGTDSNGSGTLSGVVGTRVELLPNINPASTSINYTSRWCYNTTYGCLWMSWKVGAWNASENFIALGGFAVIRGNNSSGAVAGDAIFMWANSTSATGGGSTGYTQAQCINYNTNAALASGTTFSIIPWEVTSNSYDGSVQVFPVFYWNPFFNISAFAATCLFNDIALWGTFSVAIVGSTEIPFINAGIITGTEYGLEYSTVYSVGHVLPWA